MSWHSTYFGCDGTRGLCVYEAPDAETVRRAYRAAGARFEAIWPARPASRGGTAMAVIMVEERFDPALDLSQGSPVADKISPCLPIYDMTWLSSYIAADGTRCVCVYEAPDAETVRRAYRTAGVDFVAVWSAQPLHRTDD